MVNVYVNHSDTNGTRYVRFDLPSVEECRLHCEVAAKMGYGPSLYRAFEQRADGSEQFVTAWIVRPGEVQEHSDVTIPREFF